MRTLLARLAVLVLALAALTPGWAADGAKPVQVVYHINEGLDQASNALRNIRNHLSADPSARIVLVAHAAGVDFLLKGAKDKNGNSYAAAVEDLMLAGVDFRVCNITLTSRNIDPQRVLADVRIVPSGVAEVARLQFREGFAYIKP